MTKSVQYGYVENGVAHMLNKARFLEDMKQFKNCDIVFEIKKRGKRSNRQNRYYFGVVVPEITRRLRELGNDVNSDVVHEYLKGRFNTTRIVIEATGEAMDVPKSTTELNKEEFAAYVDRIIQFCAESLDIVIPPPNTQTQMFGAHYDLATTIIE